ncbi:tautomerase family protein [Streptosporangium album]|uniref:tautomerase family protein n=1 Tax=Streptosporangium album TaxID=47479 RepID=UPI001C86B6BF|nr:tautomerase family protein [Streptosporangium album]
MAGSTGRRASRPPSARRRARGVTRRPGRDAVPRITAGDGHLARGPPRIPASRPGTAPEREPVRKITDAFVDAYQVPAETVQVWIHEVPTDSWGAAGTLTADR